MASESSQDLDSLAIKFLKLVNDVIPWRELPSEIRQDKWRILAKRVAASSGDDIQEFLHNIVKSIAGVSFYVTRSEGGQQRRLGGKLEGYVKRVKSMGREREKELVDYIKSRAIPLVIRVSGERGET